MNNFKNILTSIVLLTLIVGGVQSQNMTLSEWDKNDDMFITRSEFVETFTAYYIEPWNMVNEEGIEDKDFFSTAYTIWDLDRDGLLSEDEWIMAYDNDYGNYVMNDFVSIDMDGDGFIQYDEYYKILDGTNYFAVLDLDSDSYLSEHELARAFFNTWDLNNNGVMEWHEYRKFDNYYNDI